MDLMLLGDMCAAVLRRLLIDSWITCRWGDLRAAVQVLDPFGPGGVVDEDLPLCNVSQWKLDAGLAKCRQRVDAVVELGIERCDEVASLFERAATQLDVDLEALLQQLAPMATPLAEYGKFIGRFRAASAAADAAAPSEVRDGEG